ncbi:MAG: TadE/TadG family type IV pilus assembly protein [Gemmatimonadales bacterium]
MSLRATLSAFWRGEEATGMVEFALVAVLFSAILFGIIEFGIAGWERSTIAAAARDGSRFAVVRGANSGRIATVDSIENYIKSKTALDPASLRVYATWTPATKSPGSLVSVSVARSVPRRGPFIPAHNDSATSKLYVYY